MRYIFSICFLVLFGFSQNLEAQLNVKVGYGMSYTPAKVNDAIVSQFNVQNASRLENNMNEIHILHGLELGMRYQFDEVGVEFGWSSHASNSSASGEDVDGSLFQKELFYNFNALKLSIETYFGNKGIGFSMGRRTTVIKADIGASNIKKTLAKDHQFFLEAYWMINVKGGDFIGLSFKPFIQYPLDKFNFRSDEENPIVEYELHDFLEIDAPTQNISDRFPTIGLSLIFYNGWQKD